MAVIISNTGYLSNKIKNRPLIAWHSVFGESDLSATESSVGFQPIAMWSPDTYTKWKTGKAGGSPITSTVFISNKTNATVNYIAIVGHNFKKSGTSFQIRRFNGTTITNVTSAVVPSDDLPIIVYFNNTNDQQFEIRMVRPANSPPVYISHIKLGRMLVLERPVWGGEIPAGMDIRTESIGSKSYAGQHLGSVLVSEGEAFNIQQKNNSASFIRSQALQDFFKHAHRLIKLDAGPVETFFYAWRPDTHPAEVQYCCKINNFNPPTNQTGTTSGGLMQWGISGDAFK